MGLSENGVYRQVAILIGNMIANLPWSMGTLFSEKGKW